MRGGYQIIDLKGVDINTSPKIENLKDLFEGTKKTIMLTGIVINGVEYHNTFAEFKLASSGRYEATIYGTNIQINTNPTKSNITILG